MERILRLEANDLNEAKSTALQKYPKMVVVGSSPITKRYFEVVLAQ